MSPEDEARAALKYGDLDAAIAAARVGGGWSFVGFIESEPRPQEITPRP